MAAVYLFRFVEIVLSLLEYTVLIHVIYSWVRPQSTSFFYQLIASIVQPMFRFIRKIIPPFGPLDFTPLFCLIGIEVFAYFILQLLHRLVA